MSPFPSLKTRVGNDSEGENRHRPWAPWARTHANHTWEDKEAQGGHEATRRV